ncbi:MT-A70-domain-containing protein [Phialemonium atrogriseum]|uniref:MT-A70-domain-containing protein n=1 Tax=Phialemonium atrogriseum TaxID=1093897 RepID=A0AAJ0BYM8_9PEZI|nr:MT-A70-domain-containing protein [Phialemonium atrogriseum]KAK1766884.1 MT-A70-domain-containing protein [Phialemonium atrogriseum]
MSPASVLFQNESHTVVLLDVPRTLEEAQLLPGELQSGTTPLRRLISTKPPETPFQTPEPKHGQLTQTASTPSAQVAELMTLAAVNSALDEVHHGYHGPWCLPRLMPEAEVSEDCSSGTKRCAPFPEDKQVSPVADQVYIPKEAQFLLGTVQSQRAALISQDVLFDLMILDPPWPNRSARRKKNNYATADGLDAVRELLSLIPVRSHLSTDGLVAVWVTNAPRFAELLTSTGGIFAEWGLELVDEWTWLKVTTKGEPIYPVDSAWRKPWERLLIARRLGSSIKTPNPRKVIVAVPDIHSRKPNLRGVFAEVFRPGYLGLEVFARNLTAGWWSWGDEALHFQHGGNWADV